MTPKDLANFVLSQRGWFDLLCFGRKHKHLVDLAIVSVGTELHSSNIARNKHADPAFMKLFKLSFTRYNFSLAFAYVAPFEKETMENLLVSGFKEGCGHGLGVSNVAFSKLCFIEDGDFQKLANLHSIHDHLISRIEKRTKRDILLLRVFNLTKTSQGVILVKWLCYMSTH
ncbi:hypothetical protein CRYUN_Cryun31cG0108200 [Craigia yunnanensis]